ncbi:MAG: hypothetical protein KF760_23150 [Candidatus Eremiobacteraeota bacterium]|nr:hypothetical protein [Candidatus Eremiobacteraeota bacterium]MCW5870514.1 hypothetical protein [Candidatus Eremiobacteraeota bacterium]
MNSFTRRRFLLDLAAVGGILALAAGQELEARPLPDPELKKKMDEAIDKAFAKTKKETPPKPQPPPYPAPGKVAQPPRYPSPGVVAPPQSRP